MNPKASSLVFAALFFFFVSVNVESFSVKETLDKYPDFSGFNDLLTKTKIAETIDHLRTITLLTLDNGSLAGIHDRSIDEVKKILSDHVILEYYDTQKLRKLQKSTTVTTLYQSSGVAEEKQGFLNITRMPGGELVFGSAARDALPVAKLVKSVYTRPYNVSILQVSQPIVAPGIGEVILPPPAESPEKSSSSSDAPAASPKSDKKDEAPIPPASVKVPVASPADSPFGLANHAGSASGASRVYVAMSFVAAASMALVF